MYTGRERDAETGLQLNRFRYYHQQLGRFTSRDPSGQHRNGADVAVNRETSVTNARAVASDYAHVHFLRRATAQYPINDELFESGYRDGYNLYAGYFAMWGGMDPTGLGFWDWYYGNGWFNTRGQELDNARKKCRCKQALSGDPFDFANEFRKIQLIGADSACDDIRKLCDDYKDFLIAGTGAVGGGGYLDDLQKALDEYRNNKDFRRWWHRTYKRCQRMSGGGRDNPDKPTDDILQAWYEWMDSGRPRPN